jgi:hypothetical protein
LQPIRSGFRKVSLKVGFARVPGATLFANLQTWKAAGTLLQSSLVLNKATVGSFSFYWPEVKITEGANWPVAGPGPIVDEVTFDCFYKLNNGYMASVADQVEIVTT